MKRICLYSNLFVHFPPKHVYEAIRPCSYKRRRLEVILCCLLISRPGIKEKDTQKKIQEQAVRVSF